MAKIRRHKIQFDGDIQAVMREVSEGHPGTMSLLQTMFDRGDDALRELCVNLDDMNMRGKQVWVAYSQCCDNTIDLFFKMVNERDPGMIIYVNSMCASVGAKRSHLAVNSGGAGHDE